ncbi:type IV pilus modification protein PilV [Diaphorobacter aerolatus]|uniref:Type IV pilus modification protein PilV n=1 Tax=Diaphorobacter aerolatus TaxID=1288495 RepID=A0A7H0GGJ0_9BURK|nr:type IV pilus modification protein PilV [Diaphorobacter aerolatus]QNP47406.1 type IV pilus modification protein PilV [Diaphorobacter aerolatus]
MSDRPMKVRHSFLKKQSGAGLIEVLVAVLVVTLGLLGAAGMHVRSVEFTLDTERRQMAAMVATELLETMRSDASNILDEKGMPKSELGGYKKAEGTAMASVSAGDCQPLTADAAKRVGCWGTRAMKLMPEITTDTLTKNFSVTSNAAGLVSVTVAWPTKKGECLKKDGLDDEFCTLTLQSRL